MKKQPLLITMLINLIFMVAGALLGAFIYSVAYGFGLTYQPGRLLVMLAAFAWAGSAAATAHVLGNNVSSLREAWEQVVVCGLCTLLLTYGLYTWFQS